jgi:hypothetical protein
VGVGHGLGVPRAAFPDVCGTFVNFWDAPDNSGVAWKSAGGGGGRRGGGVSNQEAREEFGVWASSCLSSLAIS